VTAEKRLAATHAAALAVQTVGALDPFGKGKVALPSPRVYVAIFVLWSLLGLVAQGSERLARAAANLSVLVLLTAAVMGPFGAKLTGFLQFSARNFPAQEPGS
jgi:hypothetical protein